MDNLKEEIACLLYSVCLGCSFSHEANLALMGVKTDPFAFSDPFRMKVLRRVESKEKLIVNFFGMCYGPGQPRQAQALWEV